MFEFNINGIEETLSDLERRFSGAGLISIQDAALKEGAEFLKEKIRRAQESTKDTGAMYKEVTFSEPRWINGERTISVHWKGPEDRYRVVHLVENGFYGRDGRFIKPDAYGQIEGIISSNRNAYLNIVRSSIQRQIARG